MAAIGWPRRRPFGPGWLGELFAFHADRLGPTRPTKGEIVSDRFSYASGPDPRWTQLAEKVHAVVWDRIGVENIRDIIRQWAADFNRRHREAEQTRSDAAKKAETLIESVRKRTEIVLEVAEHWGDSVDISEAACFRMCDNVVPPLSGRDWPPVPEDPRLPLPPPQGDTSAAEKWAALSAIHDTFWFGETINPWPVPHDYYVAPLPTDGDAIARRKQFLEGDCYWKLLEEAKQLSADEYRPFLERSLKELVAKPDEGEENGGKKPHTEEPPKSHIIGDLRDTIRNREWSDGYTLITHIPDSFVLQRLFAYGRQKWGEGLDDREVLNRLIDEVAHFCKKPPNEVSRLSLREFSSLFSKLQAQQTEAERSVTSPAANTDEGEGTGGDVGNASGAALPGPLAASASELPAAVETPSSAPAEPQDQPPRRVGQVCYSATEAGRYIDVHESTIRRWIANHQINVFGEEGTKYWFSLQELGAKREVKAKSKAKRSTTSH